MALFKFRKNGETAPAPASLTSSPAESLEAVRRKATYRLIGAVVLVVAAVIGFPMLLDSQPRPVPVEVRIDIPDKGKVKPLAVSPPAPASVASAAAVTQAEPPAPVSASAAAPAALPSPVPPPAPKAAPAADKSAASNPPSKDDGARAQALLEGKAKDQTDTKDAASGGKFVVQVGAYADPDKARETRSKLERAGLKTYTQVAKTKDGDRIRVRVGPFADRAQAEQVAAKVKALSLDAAILTL
ncbi:MAG: hypothetical protein RLZZ126_1032 [Pseudomonadota bacterium]|jgi:DedD protein